MLACSGKVNAEVEVQVNLNITMTPSNTTQLQLRRKKICLQVMNEHPLPHHHRPSCVWTPPTTPASQEVSLQSCQLSQCHDFHVGGPGYTSYRRVPSSVASHQDDIQAKELKDQIGEILIDKRYVRLQTKLQEGTFGLVYAGLHTDAPIGAQYVMVKTVSSHASPAQVSLLLSEGMRMYGTDHHCILPVLGVCMDNPVRPMLLYPFCSRGNLKTFLLSCKTAGECHSLRSQDLVSMAVELVEGMIYLHQHGLIHRDLAARNCVVDEWLHVKIADNALARDLFPHDYHCLGDNENRPVKWLAYESLVYRDFSTASDVVSIHVVYLSSSRYKFVPPLAGWGPEKDQHPFNQPGDYRGGEGGRHLLKDLVLLVEHKNLEGKTLLVNILSIQQGGIEFDLSPKDEKRAAAWTDSRPDQA
ncbi:RYK [Cordylochernes scorpioides]|uniref:RYK n=1 Tax=Cordylochernes scorpioides TaxID=51811 RepID=A0ABY6K549_9ARAC|nr:RYK [Cordylochernes scorpioides]